jgi:Flp pilus assembly protein TadD
MFHSLDASATGFSVAPDWPAPQTRQPISGIVSLRELQHPIPKKALRAAYEAQRASKKHDTVKAIAKLEEAIRLDPAYREAHCNLGVQYARILRLAEARVEFQKALDIGPPAALLYTNMALTYTVTHELGQAAVYARKALELDPADATARGVITYTQGELASAAQQR